MAIHKNFVDQGLLNRSDALKFKRYWEARGHSVQLDKERSLYRVRLKLTSANKREEL